MKGASPPLVAVSTRDFIATLCNLSVQIPPYWHRPRNVHQRSKRPQHWQLARKIPNRVRPAKLAPVVGDHPHLLHQLLKAQIGIVFANHGIVQRDETQPPFAIQPLQILHLTRAKIALTVVQYDDLRCNGKRSRIVLCHGYRTLFLTTTSPSSHNRYKTIYRLDEISRVRPIVHR
jgi:hypothetical protein